MISTGKRTSQQKKQLSQLNRTLNSFVIGSDTNANVLQNETLKSQADAS